MASFTGTPSDDIFTGGVDNDTAAGAGGNDTLSGGAGDDTLYSAAASPAYQLPYMGGAYVLPQMDIGTEVDSLSGGDGFDKLFAGYGDNIDGGSGYDLGYISLQGASAGVTVDFSSAPIRLGGGTITGIETYHYIQGSQFGDDLKLTNARIVSGMDGDDTLTAGDSTHTLFGDAGDDLIDARAARLEDVAIYGGDGADTIYTGGLTFSTAYGGAGDDTIYATSAVDAGAGNDTVTMQTSTLADTVYGGDGDDSLTASFNGDAMTGGKGADILIGAGGDDVLSSGDRDPVTGETDDMGLEHDVLAGRAGDDTVEVGYGDDADGGANYEQGDTLFLSLGGLDHGVQFSTADLVAGGPVTLGGGVIQNFEQLAQLRGTEFSDALDLATQASNLWVKAGGGDDTITAHGSTTSVLGGAGDDRFISGTAADRFDGGAGTDIVDYGANGSGVTVDLSTGAGPGGDTLISVEGVAASAFADTLSGNGSANLLQGAGGDDRINGAAGDTLTGGAGADTFAFSQASSSKIYVTDFTLDVDRLDISALIQQAGYTGSDPMRDGYLYVANDSSDGAWVIYTPTHGGIASLYLDLQHVSPTGLTWERLNGGPTPGLPTIAFARASIGQSEGDSGSTTYNWTVTRAGDTSGTSSVHWAASGSGTYPADASDFVGGALPAGDLTFAPGETAKTISVSVAGDTAVEANEQFTVTLSNVSGAWLGYSTVPGGITNDDTVAAGRVYTADHVRSSIVAGSGSDTINASEAGDTLTGGAGADLFHFGTKPWEPAHITDFTVGSDKLDLSALLQQAGYTGSNPIGDQYISFADNGAGGTKVLFDRDGSATGQQWPDRIIELDNLAYNPANSSQILGTSVGGGAPPPTVGFSSAQGMIAHNEGDSGWTSYTWTVTRTGDTSVASSVSWATSGSGANPASSSDIANPQSQTLTFAAGETTKTLTVFAVGDTAAEADEDFTVTLTAPAGATIGDGTRVGRILNDDSAPSNGGGQVFTATQPHSTVVGTSSDDTINGSQAGDTLTGGAGADLFRFASKPWEPTHITDFQVGADKLDLTALLQQAGYTGSNPIADQYISFADNGAGGTKVLFDRDGSATGQQWPDRILELDNLAYNPANASQMLGASVGGGSTGGGGSSTVIALEAKTTTQAEGNSGLSIYSYTLTRSGDLSHGSSVGWKVAGSGTNAATAADFENGALPSGNFIFAAGETSKTIFVKVTGDTAVESDEQFTVTLSGPSGATLGNATAQGVITNDDAPPSGGGSGGQVYTAAAPHSTITGTAYNDTINGSEAADTLTGGAGADLFHFGSKPWEPTHITDFTVGADKLDLSALLQQVGYTGPDPIADRYISFADNGAGGTKVLFDKDGAAAGQQWPDRIIELDNLAYNPANNSQILGTSVSGGSMGGGSTGGGSTGGGSTGGGSTAAGQVYTSPGPNTVATGTAGADTFNASQGADTLTGGGGADVFNLPTEPWSPIHITDFTPGVDKIDLSHLFDAVGYAGTDPVADHYIYVVSDGADGSIIRFDRDGGGPNPQWPNTIIDLEHVAPAQVTSSDWIIQ